MTPRARRAATALVTAAALTLTATACGGSSSGTKTANAGSCKQALQKDFDKAMADPEAPSATETPAACQGVTDAELKEIVGDLVEKEMKEGMEDALDGGAAGGDNPDQEAATELKVGDTYTYGDGLAVTVDSIQKLTEFGEYGDKPSADETAFRVSVTIDNGTKKPFDLDETFMNAEGATNGGQVNFIYVEKGSKPITGRVAPGVKTTKTSEFSIADQYGDKVLVTFTRMGSDADPFAEDPAWTGDIN